MRWKRLPQSGALPVERSSHSITVVGNRILLFGGEHDPRVPVGSELYEYSFADGTWRVVDATGEPPTPRVAHTSAAIGNTLYIFGGRSGLAMGEGASNDLHLFDADTCTWARLDAQGAVPPKRSYHTMTAVGNKLYVFGGCGEQGRLNDLYEYDTTTNTWRQLATPSADVIPGRGGSCLVAAPKKGGREGQWVLYVIAGFCGHELDDMHAYSIADNIWCGSDCPSLLASTTTPDGRLVIHGGLDANNERLGDMFVLEMHPN